MAKQKEALPVFSDFEEEGSTLLDSLEEEKQEEELEEEEEEKQEEEPEAKKKAEEESKEEEEKEEEEEEPEAKKEEEEKKDEESEEEEEEKPEGDETFWTDVEKLTGREIQVDYGDVDPESPEGAALREEKVVQSAIEDHLNYLAGMFPKEFRALEHAANGGSIDDLYASGEPDYSKVTLSEENVDAQRDFLRRYYIRKGFKEDRASRMVATDESSDDGLFKVATDALSELKDEQEKKQSKVLEEQKERAKKIQDENYRMIGEVEKVVQSGKLNRFTVPTREREEFYAYALNHTQRGADGSYYFVTPMNSRELEQQLQNLYFTFKRGDLNSIIQREVKTETSKRLKRTADKADKKKTSGSDDKKDRGGKRSLPTFNDYEE